MMLWTLIQSMVKLLNIHYTAHQFWEQAGPRKLLLDVVKRLSVNESAFQKIPINSNSRALHASQHKALQSIPTGKVELSIVDSIVEMWKLRWLIIRSKSEMAADKVLKKFKHLSGDLQHLKNLCIQ